MDTSPYSCTNFDVITLNNVHVAVISILLQNLITSINSKTFLKVVKLRVKGKVHPRTGHEDTEGAEEV